MKSNTLQVSKPMPAKPKILVPVPVTPDTGIVSVETPVGPRFKIWYMVGDRKRLVTLPLGLEEEDARARRDTLYANLRKRYGAKNFTPKPSRKRGSYLVNLRPDTYIYQQDPYFVRIRGRLVGTSKTEDGAKQLRDQWLAEHADVLSIKQGKTKS